MYVYTYNYAVNEVDCDLASVHKVYDGLASTKYVKYIRHVFLASSLSNASARGGCQCADHVFTSLNTNHWKNQTFLDKSLRKITHLKWRV